MSATTSTVHEEQMIQAMREDMNRLRGTLFGMVDSWGLDKDRASSMKGLIRTLTYRSQGDLEGLLRDKA